MELISCFLSPFNLKKLVWKNSGKGKSQNCLSGTLFALPLALSRLWLKKVTVMINLEKLKWPPEREVSLPEQTSKKRLGEMTKDNQTARSHENATHWSQGSSCCSLYNKLPHNLMLTTSLWDVTAKLCSLCHSPEFTLCGRRFAEG